MKAYDFEYDGLNLSDTGFVICKFGSDGLQTVTNGSQITFNTVSTLNGSQNVLISSEYNECLEATFQICKNPCSANDNLEITPEELRYIMSWLNRKGFHKFKLFDLGYMDLYFEGSFNINKIEMNGKVYGLELNLFTNRPYALHDPQKITIESTKSTEAGNSKKWSYSIVDISDEEGFIYPHMEIDVGENGDLSIYNDLDDRTMLIKNCVAGEKITINYPVIQSSLASHKIQNDFNWNFFRIANKFDNKVNNLTISIPCTITITYSPIVKLTI